MSVVRRIVLFIAAVGLLAAVVAPTASAQARKGPVVTQLASSGNGGFVTGSTIGPDGAQTSRTDTLAVCRVSTAVAVT